MITDPEQNWRFLSVKTPRAKEFPSRTTTYFFFSFFRSSSGAYNMSHTTDRVHWTDSSSLEKAQVLVVFVILTTSMLFPLHSLHSFLLLFLVPFPSIQFLHPLFLASSTAWMSIPGAVKTWSLISYYTLNTIRVCEVCYYSSLWQYLLKPLGMQT